MQWDWAIAWNAFNTVINNQSEFMQFTIWQLFLPVQIQWSVASNCFEGMNARGIHWRQRIFLLFNGTSALPLDPPPPPLFVPSIFDGRRNPPSFSGPSRSRPLPLDWPSGWTECWEVAGKTPSDWGSSPRAAAASAIRRSRAFRASRFHLATNLMTLYAFLNQCLDLNLDPAKLLH